MQLRVVCSLICFIMRDLSEPKKAFIMRDRTVGKDILDLMRLTTFSLDWGHINNLTISNSAMTGKTIGYGYGKVII